MKALVSWFKWVSESVENADDREVTKAFFFVCLLIFTASQVYLTAAPAFNRQLPVEVDDAYGYVLKAEEMRAGCFFQDCPALNALRSQFIRPTDNLDTAYVRAREYHRVFVVYHPLHSTGLLVLRALGFSYESGYAALAITGKVLLCLGLAYWLLALFGYGPAGITLLLLVPIVFVGQGIHTIVPSNMALAIAFVLWGMIATRHRRMITAILPLVLAMVLLHQVGRIYAGIGVALFFITWKRPFSRSEWQMLAASGFVLLLSFLLPVVLHNPELNFNPADFYSGTWNYFEEFIREVPGFLNIINIWFKAYVSPWIPASLITFGIATLMPRPSKDWIFHGAGLASFLIFSIVYIVPWFGALTFERAWVPFAIFLTALISYGVWVVLVAGVHCLSTLWANRTSILQNKLVALKQNILPFIAIFVFGYIGFNAIEDYSAAYDRLFTLTLGSTSRGSEYFIDTSQPTLVNLTNSSTTLFLDEWPLYYFLINGGMDNRSIYLPAIHGTAEEKAWLNGDQIDYVVRLNPIYHFVYTIENGIQLPAGGRFEFGGVESTPLHSFSILISEVPRDIQLRIDWQSGEQIVHTRFIVPKDNQDWLTISQSEIEAERVTIRIFGEVSLVVQGLRIHPEIVSRWPWESSIELLVKSPDTNAETFLFSNETLYGELPFKVQVQNDNGVTVVGKVIH